MGRFFTAGALRAPGFSRLISERGEARSERFAFDGFPGQTELPAKLADSPWETLWGRAGLWAEPADAPLIDLSSAVSNDVALRCGCAYCMKGTTSFLNDSGEKPAAAGLVPALLTTDTVGDDTSTTATITVDGPHLVSTIDVLGDVDVYAVQLVAGEVYNFGMYRAVGGPSGVPIIDSYVELYDANGELIVSADGGKPGDDQGLDALLAHRAEYTGTYYVAAQAYDQSETGPGDDGVGDYELFVDRADPDDAYTYVPFYSPDSPLHSIDWGSQIDRTSRNPDGDNGTRSDNGVPNGGAPIANNPYGIEGKNVITYYFAETGDVFVSEDPLNPGLTTTIVAQGMQDWEMETFEKAFELYEQVADVVYIRVDNRQDADFKIITYEGTPGAGASLLGRMSPPNTDNEGQMEINTGDVRWTREGVSPGGFYFPTLLHELGHGHGMAHPHDNGGRSSIMRGTDDGSVIGGALGDFDLNQQVFTIMAYNDGWATSPYGQPRSGGLTGTEVDHYGWVASLSPLDIAVIQDKYGVNEEWATGDDVYVLRDENGPGASYTSIWDGGGTDEIRYDGARDAVIDLRAATLKYEEGGGGRVSYAWGVHNGFTITNGVTVENATGGAGNDALTGNAAANRLSGRGGADVLSGGAGDDVLQGGFGDDQLDGGDGYDVADYSDTGGVTVDLNLTGAQNTGGAGIDTLVSIEGVVGSGYADMLFGRVTADRLAGGGGNDSLYGGDGDDVLDGGAGADRLDGGAGVDTASYRGATSAVTVDLATGVHGGEARDDLFTSIEVFELGASADRFTGSSGADTVFGLDGADVLAGGAGADRFWGGAGDDVLTGGAGADRFLFEAGFGRDRITDFRDHEDKIHLVGVEGVDDFSDLRVSRDAQGNAVVTYGDGTDSITLTGVSVFKIGADDFVFGG